MNETIDDFHGKYYFLSNFHPCKVEYEGISYPSSEHAYQAAKSLNEEIRHDMARQLSPGRAKRMGQTIKLRPDWEDIKIDVMRQILKIKFANPTLKQKLLDTGDANLIEGNFWGDTFWGVCDGKGSNHLGLLLMELRDALRR